MKTKTDKQVDLINERLLELLNSEPLIEFRNPSNEIDVAQKYSLAQCFRDRGLMRYLENAWNTNIKNAGLSKDIVSVLYNQARAIMIKELLSEFKKCYSELENVKIKSKAVSNADPDGRTFIQEKIDATSQG